MMSPNDPVDSFLNSVEVVKELLSPLEVCIRQAAKFEHCWAGNGAQVSQGRNFQICGVKKKTKGLNNSRNGSKEKALTLNNSRNGSKEKALTKEDDGSFTNRSQFAVNWSLLINGFLHSLPTPFKSGQKPLQKMDAQVHPCLHWNFIFPWESKLTEFNCQSVEIFRNKDVKKEEEEVNHISFECLIGFISDHLTSNLHKLDQGLQGNDCDREKLILLHPSSDPNHLKAFTSSILKGHQVYATRFFQFAKLGGVPSSVVEASHLAKDDSAAVENREDMGRIKSSASVISSTELMELLQQHPDMNKLSSGQDFIKYRGRREEAL